MILRRSIGLLSALAILVVAGVSPYRTKSVEAARPVPGAIPALTFPADPASLGAIPDHVGTCQTGPFNAGRNVTFTVSGLTGTVASVEISTSFGPAHTWMVMLRQS
jgi:hypothetical protein